MKKTAKIFSVLILISFALAIVTPALAIQDPEKPAGVPEGLLNIINKISSAILFLVGTIAVLFIIIGGFQYITSAGNPDSIERAKTTILYAIIGIIACLLAYAVVQYIVGKF